MNMTKSEMKAYKLTSEVTMDECYVGGKYCSSCMYAFPGNIAIDLAKTDCNGTEPNICTCCKR